MVSLTRRRNTTIPERVAAQTLQMLDWSLLGFDEEDEEEHDDDDDDDDDDEE